MKTNNFRGRHGKKVEMSYLIYNRSFLLVLHSAQNRNKVEDRVSDKKKFSQRNHSNITYSRQFSTSKQMQLEKISKDIQLENNLISNMRKKSKKVKDFSTGYIVLLHKLNIWNCLYFLNFGSLWVLIFIQPGFF